MNHCSPADAHDNCQPMSDVAAALGALARRVSLRRELAEAERDSDDDDEVAELKDHDIYTPSASASPDIPEIERPPTSTTDDSMILPQHTPSSVNLDSLSRVRDAEVVKSSLEAAPLGVASSSTTSPPKTAPAKSGKSFRELVSRNLPPKQPQAPTITSAVSEVLKKAAEVASKPTLEPLEVPPTPTSPSGNVLSSRRKWIGYNSETGECERLNVDDILENESTWNPLNLWKTAYLRYCCEVGGSAARKAIRGTLDTLGIVGALIAAIILNGLQQAPICLEFEPYPICHLDDQKMTIYSSCASCALVTSLGSVVFTITAQTWFAVYKNDEMVYFINTFYGFGIAAPIVLLCLAVVLVVVATATRLYMVYGMRAFITMVIISGIAGCALIYFLMTLSRRSLTLRKERWELTEKQDDEFLLRKLGSIRPGGLPKTASTGAIPPPKIMKTATTIATTSTVATPTSPTSPKSQRKYQSTPSMPRTGSNMTNSGTSSTGGTPLLGSTSPPVSPSTRSHRSHRSGSSERSSSKQRI